MSGAGQRNPCQDRSVASKLGTSRNPVDVTAQVIFEVGYAPGPGDPGESDALDAILVSGSLAHPTYIERDLAQLPSWVKW
ncbi:MAG: hypothetical protein Ct9H300mP16_05610 [Pseudomonadota bacterium]|nr:MAG: hypothetical protein Ct9H300mP16_05610 [Pseudomonadota bacterium]